MPRDNLDKSMPKTDIKFTDNPLTAEDPKRYLRIEVRVSEVVKSWRDSIFSFEWLHPDGHIKAYEELTESEQQKRAAVDELLEKGQPIPLPILGIGIMDNIEIGVGRAEFLTLAAQGIKIMPVHIPKSNETDFKPFRTDIK